MKIGDLIQIVSREFFVENSDLELSSYPTGLLSKVGIVVEIEYADPKGEIPRFYLTLIKSKLYSIPEYNAKLVINTED
jgi:intein-encoded DNA endonuclease-like protein